MTTMITETAGIFEQNELAGNSYCRAILQFFKKYPFARFSKLTVVHTLNVGNSIGFEEALQQLIDRGMITVQSRNNVNFYILNDKK